jgi:hypothetical protein
MCTAKRGEDARITPKERGGDLREALRREEGMCRARKACSVMLFWAATHHLPGLH